MNSFIDFPTNIHEVLKEFSKEYKLKFLKETHYEAINRELKLYDKDKINILNFEFDNQKNYITVIYSVNRFPLCIPRILEWCHNYIPMFPYYAKTTWRELLKLPLGLSKNEYRKKIKLYIEQTLKVRKSE